jgi:hypothetical protein
LFEQYASLLNWVIQQQLAARLPVGTKWHWVSYVDDSVYVAHPTVIGLVERIVGETLTLLNIPESRSKRQRGAKVTFIGYQLDFATGTIYIDSDKQVALLATIDETLRARHITAAGAAQLLGRLAFNLAACPSGRGLTRALSAARHAAAEKSTVIALCDETLEDLGLLRVMVANNPGKTTAVKPVLVLVSDASGVDGGGAFWYAAADSTRVYGTCFTFPETAKAPNIDGTAASSTLLEALAIKMALCTAIHHGGFSSCDVIVACDALNVRHILKAGRALERRTNRVVKSLMLLAARFDVTLIPVHIRREEECIMLADELTHFRTAPLLQGFTRGTVVTMVPPVGSTMPRRVPASSKTSASANA